MDVHECVEIINDICHEAVQLSLEGEAPECRDEKDRKYLHCSTAGSADFLITFDDDLLVLCQIADTVILKPGAFLSAVAGRASSLLP